MNENINHVLILGCGQTGLSIGKYLDSNTKISFYDENVQAINNARNLFTTKKNLYLSGDIKESYFVYWLSQLIYSAKQRSPF